MSEPGREPQFEIRASGPARFNVAGAINANIVNFGDTYEVQRQILVLDVDPFLPKRDPQQWIDRTQPQTDLKARIDAQTSLVEIVAAGGFGKSLLATWAYEQTQAQFTKGLLKKYRLHVRQGLQPF